MKVRLPVDLKDRLTDIATQNGRSLNAEVVKRLEDSVASDGHPARAVEIDVRMLDLFAEKVGEVLDRRESRRKGP
ncbi:Arc family DNA-binding protein [Burkholderia sp. AU19243]|nr:Arc family DNA-binding protein [Burkholderia vietnamiensis]MBR8364917.1 Arc family DNA-binding protein [Burkholderia sp. AU19243]